MAAAAAAEQVVGLIAAAVAVKQINQINGGDGIESELAVLCLT